jgi:hypothetical protein
MSFIIALLKFGNNFDVKAGPLPPKEPIKKIQNLDQIYCSTINIPVKMDCIYDSVAGKCVFKNIFHL